MKIKNLRELLNQEAKKQGSEIVKHSSNISWLYPGQFAYCLNEEFLWDRYGSFLEAPETHFHKIQPVIRWDDFVTYFQDFSKKDSIEDCFHLGNFDMSTITGGHIVSSEEAKIYEKQAFKGLFDFLIKTCGLKKENFEVTYFIGAKLSDIGKGKNGFSKYDFDFDFAPDINALRTLWRENGLGLNQIWEDKSRNCFLIPNWACGEIAPWGYRNEINYRTPFGLVDIATIERLSLIPKKKDDKIVSIEPWEKSFIIAGAGLERLSMVSEGLKRIQDVDNIKQLSNYCSKYENPLKICESLRVFHRIVADSNGNLSDRRGSGKNRKPKYNQLMRNLYKISKSEISEMLEINSESNSWYTELDTSKEKVISELERYSRRVK
ncbi:MAG: hypothetical protein ACOYT4_00080 [Nanoarchaeota archaeon]